MGLPMMQAARIGSYVVKQAITGKKRYPLVLMLEPLFRCNLACAGCGKIDYPDEILNQRLSYEQCMEAIDECGGPRRVDRWRRAPAAPRHAQNREGLHREEEVRGSCARTPCC